MYLLQAMARWPAHQWALLLVGGMLLLLTLATRVGDVPGAQRLDQALLWSADQTSAEAVAVELPHVWHNERRDWSGQATYRLQLPASLTASGTGQDLGLLLARVGVRYRVLFQGQELAERCWYRVQGYCDAGVHVQVVRLPMALLAAAGPQRLHLDIEVRGQALRISGLTPVHVGPWEAVQSRYHWMDWWQVNLTWMVAACAGLMGLLSLMLWLRTGERLFGLLAGGMLVLTVRLWLSTPLFLPGPFAFWDYVHKLSFTWYCGFLYLFISELFDFRQGFVRRLVMSMMVIGPLWLLLLEWTVYYPLYRWWTGVIVAVCMVALGAVVHRARWGMNVNQRLMVVVGVAVMVTGLRDFLVVQLGLPGDADVRWMTPGSLVLMFAMGWVLVRRMVQGMEQVALLNAELTDRVLQRERELQAAFERLRLIDNQRVLESERRRLTRDMHDGLGSQLVQTLNLVRASGAQVDSATVALMLEHALDDLRLTLDSLEPMESDLPTILGTLRQRIGPALQAAGIELDWQVEDVPPVPTLQAQGVMHLFRCLQEVFANVVKHAHARRVTVRTGVQEGCVVLQICDDGVGMRSPLAAGRGRADVIRSGPPGATTAAPDSFPSGGRGLGHVRLRLTAIGAEMHISDANPGTCVALRFVGQDTRVTTVQDTC